MDMEKEKWISHILNSVDGIKPVNPPDALFLKIQQGIQYKMVPSRTLWLVAASVAALALLNVAVLANTPNTKPRTADAYLEMTVNRSNQLYQ